MGEGVVISQEKDAGRKKGMMHWTLESFYLFRKVKVEEIFLCGVRFFSVLKVFALKYSNEI